MKLHENNPVGIRCYGFGTYRNCQDMDFPIVEVRPELKEDKISAVDSLLDSIFAVNPRTKLPDCDITVFMSSNTSDSVKKYIQDNLLADNGGCADSSKYPDLPDSVIADYARSSDENIYQYRDRMVKLMRENYKEYKSKKTE